MAPVAGLLNTANTVTGGDVSTDLDVRGSGPARLYGVYIGPVVFVALRASRCRCAACRQAAEQQS